MGNLITSILGFIIIAATVIFMFRSATGTFSILVMTAVVLGVTSFIGWFVLDMIH